MGRPRGRPSSAIQSSIRSATDWTPDRQADSFDSAELGGGLEFIWTFRWLAFSFGPATYLPRVEPMETRNEFADDVSWAMGRHMIKFGFTFGACRR